VKSCHDVSSGGLAIALAECCFGTYGKRGASFELKGASGRKDGLLFAETGARYIVSCAPDQEKKITDLAREFGVEVTGIGTTGGKNIEIKGLAKIGVEEAYDVWANALRPLFR
jgi:phosphoribosylformylglycinamidine synthase